MRPTIYKCQIRDVKFGENVKIVSPLVVPQEAMLDKTNESGKSKPNINFDLKPEELISYLDQYVIKQDSAKAILATKVCMHLVRDQWLQ